MIQLIVQGEELDLFKSEVFAISKAVSKVGQFDLRFGDVSISFSVPSTSKNNRIFRYLSNLNNQNLGAFKRFEGEIREDDAVLSAGYYQVLSVNENKKSFKVRFLGGNSDWFDLIKDRFINVEYPKEVGNPNSTSYSLGYLNHKLEESVIVNSKDNEDGYFYFLADTGLDSDRVDNTVFLKDFSVGVYEHTILSNIFNSVGIKTEGNIFNDPLYYNTIITASKDLSSFSRQNDNKRFRSKQNETVPSIITDTDTDFASISFTRDDTDTQWNGDLFTSEYDYDNILFSGSVVTNTNSMYFTLSGARIDVRVLVNGVEEDRLTSAPTSNSDNASLQFSWAFEFDGVNLPLIAVGDTVEIQYVSNSSANNFIPDVLQNGVYPSIESYLRYDMEGVITDYEVNNALPKIKQSDFIKDIMFRLGVVSTYNPKKRVVSFNKFQSVEDNKTKAIDLTDKIDISKDISIDFTKVVSKYFKTSFVNYKEDDKDAQLLLFRSKFVAKTGLGDGKIFIDNDNLTDEGDIFTSVYSASKDVRTFPLDGDDFNFYLPYLPVYNGEDTQELQPRILIANKNTSVESFSNTYSDIIFDGGGTYTNIGYAFFAKQIVSEMGLIDNSLDANQFTLSFENFTKAGQTYTGRTLLESNYNLYKKILNNPVYVPIHLNLNNLDVQDYDPLIPVWLDFKLDSGYYYWEEISQYKGDGSTTKCALVKI